MSEHFGGLDVAAIRADFPILGRMIGDKPLVPDKRSVEWCLKGVDQCWSQKKRFIKNAEMAEAQAAYDHARATYRDLLAKAKAK